MTYDACRLEAIENSDGVGRSCLGVLQGHLLEVHSGHTSTLRWQRGCLVVSRKSAQRFTSMGYRSQQPAADQA
jgi:hypothetical protein